VKAKNLSKEAAAGMKEASAVLAETETDGAAAERPRPWWRRLAG
jgi:hypothetical protein